MQLIVITPEHEVKDETKIVNTLFANGLLRLHLRKPLFTSKDHTNYINGINSEYHQYIAIHSCFELLNEFDLGGIHLNSITRNDIAAWKNFEQLPSSKISTSFHSWQEIRDNEFQYGYVFISPVFDSISKRGYKTGIDLTGAMETKELLTRKKKYCPTIIGLGGVGAENIKLLNQYDFDGAALLGSIWMSDDPVAALKEVMTITSRF